MSGLKTSKSCERRNLRQTSSYITIASSTNATCKTVTFCARLHVHFASNILTCTHHYSDV